MSKHPPPTTHPVVEVILRDAEVEDLQLRVAKSTVPGCVRLVREPVDRTGADPDDWPIVDVDLAQLRFALATVSDETPTPASVSRHTTSWQKPETEKPKR